MRSLRFLSLAIMAAFIFLGLHVNAQQVVDTAAAAVPGPIIPADNIDGIPIPAWLQTAVIALVTLLPAIQLVLKRIPTSYSVKIGGIIGKVLDALTFFQKDRSSNGGVHMIIFLVALSLLAGSNANAQSFFKPIPKKATAMRFLQVYGDSVIVAPAAPTMTAFRPVVNAVTYSEPDHIAMAGVGVSYQWLKYNSTTQKWDATFAVNWLFYGGAGLASPNQGIYAAGPSISLFNGFLSFGGAYNFTTKKLGPTLGINVQLNN